MRSRPLFVMTLCLLAGLAGFFLLPQEEIAAHQPDADARIMTTDWAVAETLHALQVPFVGMGEKRSYNKWVESSGLSDDVVDFGMRVQPNAGLLASLRPTLLINSSWYAGFLPEALLKIPSETVDFFTDTGTTWESTTAATLKVGEITQHVANAEQLVNTTQQLLQEHAQQLAPYSHRPVAVIQFIDTRTVRIYGARSVYGVAIEKMGLRNAWQKPTDVWGNIVIPLVTLANFPADTIILIVRPLPANMERQLNNSVVWTNLPANQPGNIHVLPAIWSFGGLLSIQRFSTSATKAIVSNEEVKW